MQVVVADLGHSFVKFDESASTNKVHIDVELIEAAHDILAALHSKDSNLAFNSNTLKDIVKALLKMSEDTPSWLLADKHHESYMTAMSKHVANFCFCANQAS